MSICLVQPLPYHASPVERFSVLREAPGAILLDSGKPASDRGRYDIFSAWPLSTLKPHPEENGRVFLQRLRQALAELGNAQMPEGCDLPFAGGLLGYLSYDFGRRLENVPDQARDDIGLPDGHLGVYDWALINDHQARTSQLVFHPCVAPSRRAWIHERLECPAPSLEQPFQLTEAFRPDLTAEQYRTAFERLQAYILAGDCYQVNYTQRFRARFRGEPWTAYQALRSACPTPFSGFMALPDNRAILSLSPERFVRVSHGQAETRPIKGTRPRGVTPEDDRAQAKALLASEKDRAENLMIVDLLRNDLGRTCRTGSVRVPELFSLESYPNVHHLVSAITGELAAGKDALDLIGDSFPGGSITGAPKIRAMQIIDELEPTRRGLYCGSLLYLDVRGEMDSSIAIRSLLASEGHIACWAGGGIVADSEWEAEYEESFTKVNLLLRTLERFSNS